MDDIITERPREPIYLPQRRRLKERKPPFVLQSRDVHMLRAVFENRFLTLSLLARLFPPDPARTPAHRRIENPKHPNANLAARLGKLYHHSFLDRVRTVRGGELIYALADKGAGLLRSEQLPLFVPDTDWAEKNRTLTQPNIDHALMVARLRIALAANLGKTGTTILDHFERESRDLKAEWQHAGARVYVVPDAFFILRDTALPEGNQRTAFFLEADRSTMSLKRMREKFQNYSQMYVDRMHQERFRIPRFRVLLVTKSEERMRSLLALVADAEQSCVPTDHRGFFLFTTELNYREHPSNILAAIWWDGGTPHEPRAIIPSPLARA